MTTTGNQTATLLLIAGDPIHAEDRAAIVAAIRSSVRPDGTVTANAWRPNIPATVYPRCVGAVVCALVKAGVLVPTHQLSESADARGRNLGKWQPIYRWVERKAAAA